MSNLYIGANVGSTDMGSTVTNTATGLNEGTAPLSVDVQVNILSTNNPNKKNIILILEQVIRYIEDGRTAIFPGI